jgi:hypothetical protein
MPSVGRERRVLSEEEELERRVRMEVMGGGGGLRDQQQGKHLLPCATCRFPALIRCRSLIIRLI